MKKIPLQMFDKILNTSLMNEKTKKHKYATQKQSKQIF